MSNVNKTFFGCKKCGKGAERLIGGFCEPCYCEINACGTECSKCGVVFAKDRRSGSYPDSNDMCFGCNYWMEMIQQKEHRIFISGNCYTIGKNDDVPSSWKGHGGRKYRIFLKSEVIGPYELLISGLVETDNLWHNGVVPEIFRDVLPDNAEFLPASKEEVPIRPVDLLAVQLQIDDVNSSILDSVANIDRRGAIGSLTCATCEGKADLNGMSDIERKAYRISGMCKPCQDKAFTPPEDGY